MYRLDTRQMSRNSLLWSVRKHNPLNAWMYAFIYEGHKFYGRSCRVSSLRYQESNDDDNDVWSRKVTPLHTALSSSIPVNRIQTLFSSVPNRFDISNDARLAKIYAVSIYGLSLVVVRKVIAYNAEYVNGWSWTLGLDGVCLCVLGIDAED